MPNDNMLVLAGHIHDEPVVLNSNGYVGYKFSIAIKQPQRRGVPKDQAPQVDVFQVAAFGSAALQIEAQGITKGDGVHCTGRLTSSPKRDGQGTWMNVRIDSIARWIKQDGGETPRPTPTPARQAAGVVADVSRNVRSVPTQTAQNEEEDQVPF